MSQSSSPVGPDGVVRCYEHNEPAPLRTSRTSTNPGRPFYCCYKDQSDKQRCKFFKWQDELFPASVPMPSSSSSQQPSASEAQYTFTDPPATPRKRTHNTEDEPFSSSKRTKFIPAYPSTPTSNIPEYSPSPSSKFTPSTDKGRAARLAALQAAVPQSTSQPSSQHNTKDEPYSSSKRTKFTPAYPSTPTSNKYSPSPSSKFTPSTDKGRAARLAALQAAMPKSTSQPSPQSDNVQESDEEADMLSTPPSQPSTLNQIPAKEPRPQAPPEDSWSPLTPPSSFSHDSKAMSHGREQLTTPSPSPPKVKGKGKSLGESWDWVPYRADPARLFEESSIGVPRPSSRASVESIVSQNTDSGPAVSSASISTLLQGLSSVPAYAEKLERKLATAQKIIKDKSERINHLEEENRMLKAKISDMEDNIALLEA